MPSKGCESLFPSHELARLLFWTKAVSRPVADGGRANDELCEVEARDLYNLSQALDAVKELMATQPVEIPHATMWDGSRTCWCGEHHPWEDE